MSGLLSDKVALISGAAAGIGAAVTRRFAEEGATLWINDIRPEALDVLVAALAGDDVQVTATPGDASDPSFVWQAALPPGRRGAPGRAGRRQRHHEVRGRAVAPPLPRRLRAAPRRAVRLTNVFGPRQRLRDDLQGFLPIFVRRALADDAITVFGDGDAGARLPLRRRRRRVPAAPAARRPTPPGEIFNVGNDERLSLGAIADGRGRAAGTGRVEHVPWPPDRDAIDIGSYFGDSSKAKRTARAGSRARRSPTASRARSRSTANGDLVPVTDDGSPGASPRSRRRPRPPRAVAGARALGGGGARRCGRARTCSVPSSTRSRPSSRRSPAGGTRSGWRRAPTRSGSRWSRWASARRRGARPGVHRGADRRRGVRDRRDARVRRRRPRHRDARSRPRRRPR